MTTMNQVITRSMQSLGILGRNEVPSAGEANDALVTFNAMLDSWSNDPLFSFVVLERSFSLTVGTNSYTIGSGGVISTTRPNEIVQAYVRDTGGNNFGMEIVTRDKFNQIGNRSSTITSQIPDTLFYDPQYPLGVINIFPTPLLAYTLFYDSTQDQVDPSLLTTTLSVPPGYERCYVLNLALELMGVGYPCLLDEKQLAMLINNASDAKAAIKRSNIIALEAEVDPAIVSRSYATFNIFRGS